MSDVLVLCYHAVSPKWDADLSVTPATLERHVEYLLARGWRAALFHDAVMDPPAPRTMAITFDDAFASVHVHAAPVLRSLAVPATVFAPTAYIDSGVLSWPGIDHWERTPSADELAASSWDDLGGLLELGWEIGSHTRTHPRLTELDSERLTAELAESREDCSRRLSAPCRTIAYPYGDVDQRVADCARATGYVAGAALSHGLAPLGVHRYPRVGIYRADSWARFRLKMARSTRALRASRLWPR